MRTRISALALLAMIGCSEPESSEGQQASRRPTPPPAAASLPAEPVSFEADNALIEFEYSYPAEAAAIPALKLGLDKEAAELRRTSLEEAASGQRDAAADGFPFHKHSFEKKWEVAADAPSLLTLIGEGYQFQGGAHGMSLLDVLVWDRAGVRAIGLKDVVTDFGALIAALTPAFCSALDVQRAEKRGGETAMEGAFGACPDLDELPIALVGLEGEITTLRALAGPYVAGPYAEGTYEVDLPVTPRVRALVKPQYASAFAS